MIGRYHMYIQRKHKYFPYFYCLVFFDNFRYLQSVIPMYTKKETMLLDFVGAAKGDEHLKKKQLFGILSDEYFF